MRLVWSTIRPERNGMMLPYERDTAAVKEDIECGMSAPLCMRSLVNITPSLDVAPTMARCAFTAWLRYLFV